MPGLRKNRISVVSTEGVTLHRPSQDGSVGSGTDDLSEDAQALSSQLEAKAIAQLERVVGPGGADVRVTVTLDPSTKEQTKEVYQPEKTALRSEQQSEEDIRSQSPGALGIPGARTNMPDADGGSQTQASGSQNLDSTTRRSHTRNFEIDRTVEKVHTPAGAVARLSVAVLLNGTWQKQKSGPDLFVPRPQAEVDQLAQVVRQAVGYDELRGDSITVSAAQFARDSHLSEAVVPPVLPLYQQPKVLLAALGALVLATLLTVLLVWRRKKKDKKLAEAEAKRKALEVGTSPGIQQLGGRERRDCRKCARARLRIGRKTALREPGTRRRATGEGPRNRGEDSGYYRRCTACPLGV